MRFKRKTVLLSTACLAGFLFGGGDAISGVKANKISSLASSEDGGTTTLTITGTATPTFTVYKLEKPSRLVIDVANATLDGQLASAEDDKASWSVNSWAVNQVIASARVERESQLVRIVVSLARPSSYGVKANGNKLLVRVSAREAAPVTGANDAALVAARRAEKKAEAAARLAVERAAQAEARAARETERANSINADAAKKRDAETAKQTAEVAKREAAEARLAAVLAEKDEAEKRAQTAERETRVAKSEAVLAKKEADERAAKATREAEVAREAARRASAEAAERLNAADARIAAANGGVSRAKELLAAAEKARADAKKAASEAAASEKSAKGALALADKRRVAAESAEKEAARMREEADRARATGSSQSAKLARRAEEAARAADERRQEAESAARVAQSRRLDAEKAEKAALDRSKSTSAAVAVAEQRRQSAQEAQKEAETARLKAESENRELIAKIDSARARATEAANRAEGFVKAAETARAQAAEAQKSRLAEERALERAAQARVVAEREKQRAEAASTELRASIAALKSAEASLAASKAAAANAASSADRAASGERADREKQAEERALELAAAEKTLGQRKTELAASERKARDFESARDKAASELAALKTAAAAARVERQREEAAAARLEDQKKGADEALRQAETRLAEAQKHRDKARADAVVAEAARKEAETDRAAANVDRRRAAADRKEAAELVKQANAAEKIKKAKPADKTPSARVSDVKFEDKGTTARVVVGLSAPAEPKVIKNRGTVAVLEIEGVDMATDLERTLDTSAFRGPIKAISSYRDPKKPGTVRVVVDLFQPARGVLKKVGNTYYWDFPNPNAATASKAATQPTAANATAALASASTSITQQTVAQVRPGRRRVYRGRKIDLNFKDADIHNLLRILATVGGVNIVVPQAVTGTVTVRLKSVPWDQAMEVILSSQGLWYRRDGSLIRVAKREALEAEDEAEDKRRAASIKAEAPEPEIFTLNYADAKEVKAQLGGLVSPKGRIEVDPRTNALIVNDIAAHRRRIIDLATRLDTQTPQIQIEARIVEARTTFVREFGVQWGGNAAATPQGGNPTGLVFPNSIGLAGAADDGQTPNAGVGAAPTNFAVNLPAPIGTGSGGGLGLALGSVGGNFNINLRISALEDTGSARIISAPKITVSNNVKAKIKSGVSIPISVVSANGTQTQFVPADLALEVTPKVSQRDCSVSMTISVSKNEADFANTGARGDPSILTKEASTTILVADNETAVIGGIYTRNTGLNYSKVPFFADIPVIGYFFKNRRENDERSEVLVFVTPKITNRAFLRCE